MACNPVKVTVIYNDSSRPLIMTLHPLICFSHGIFLIHVYDVWDLTKVNSAEVFRN